MTVLLTVHALSKAHGTHVLFENISFTLCSGDRIGLIGPNGAGKSSLIKILAGIEGPDSGRIAIKQDLKVGYASQTPVFPSEPIEQFLIGEAANETDPYTAQTKARILLGKAEFSDFNHDASLLSGGWKKRLDIVRAMMNEPDILLLDEPTNHLDLEGILWLENFLKRLNISYLVISHDRYFLENVANEIIELNKCYPDGMLLCKGNMSVYQKQKDDYLNNLDKKERELSYKVREETAWLRTSPKARTTKSQSRVQKAYRLMDELSDIKQKKKQDRAGIDFLASERETRKLLAAKNISKSFGGKNLFNNLDLTLSPGTRVGIVGKNGTGKTTLLKVLSGIVAQDTGTIKYADDLQIVYFDQHRESIPSNVTLKEALCPYGDTVNYRGQEIHVNGWAKRFLFPAERLNLPVNYLSGGERARILIAKLMLKPADILFLDEPTNDLDIQTLEVIEENLQTFPGAVVMISHDRCLMDNICTQIVGLTESHEHKFLASYGQWENYCASIEKLEKKLKKETPKPQKKPAAKLSYKEKIELEAMEQTILETENELEKLHEGLKGKEDDLKYYQEMAAAQKRLDALYHRWQYLLDREKG